MTDMESIREAVAMIKSGALAAFGGIVGYLVDVANKDKAFSWISYAIFVLTAFFVGQVLDSWMPGDLPGRGGVLMVAGTTAYPVLQALRAQVIKIVDRHGA